MINSKRTWLLVLSAIAVCTACSTASAPSKPVVDPPEAALSPARVTLHAAPNVFVDASAQFGADALTDSGASSSRPVWSTDDPEIAVVNQNGLVIGHDTGTTLVRAVLGERDAGALVKVVADNDSTIEIIAHRGFMRRFPENTLVAVRGAFANGADAVEVDIRLSVDRVPVVMHDETVDRTTNGHGYVKDLTFAQLTALNACVRAGAGMPTTCPLPSMADVLAAAHGSGGVLLHLYGAYTADDLSKILDVVRGTGMERKTLFICFDYPTLQTLRQLDPTVPLGYLSTGLASLDQIDALGRAAALPELQASLAASSKVRDYLIEARRRRVDFGIWVVTTQDQARAAVALGFRHLISDVPLDRAALGP